jgi:hypothetical protein
LGRGISTAGPALLVAGDRAGFSNEVPSMSELDPLPFHPVAGRYPLMEQPELEALADDLAANGQRLPVWTYQGLVIDGRNRFLAARLKGLDLWEVEYQGPPEKLEAFCESLNEHRRHLSPEFLRQRRQERIARVAEKRHEGKSLRTIADEEEVSLGQVQRDLGEASAVSGDTPEPDRVTGRDGKQYPAALPRAVLAGPLADCPPEVQAVLGGSSSWAAVHADRLDFLRALPADSVDLVLGSPPYGGQRSYNMGFDLRGQAWVDWVAETYREALRVCTGLVAFVLQGETKDYAWSGTPALLMADLLRAGVTLRNPPIYHRVGIPGSGGPDWLRNDYEFVVCATRGGPLPWSDNTAMGHAPRYAPGGDLSHRRRDGSRVNGYATMEERNSLGPHRARQRAGRVYEPPEKANPGNVIRCSVGGGNMGDSDCHDNEAAFAEDLAAFFVRSFCPPGGVALDCFSGSGTTGKTAVLLGRRFVGCDVRADQVELSRRRIGQLCSTA